MVNNLILALCFLLAILLQNGTLKHWLNPPLPPIPGPYSVVLYSTTWCGYCAKTRTFFEDNRIAYQDIDVERTAEGRQAYQRLGANGVPIVVINNDTIIRGYAPEQIAASLITE